MKIKYDWMPELGYCECELSIGNNKFYGEARCHEDDFDMCSERTGRFIAETRATIAYLQHVRSNELRPQLKALMQLYYSMDRSQKFNAKSYENKMLQRQIRFIKKELATVSNKLALAQENLREILQEKDKFYQKVRARRSRVQNS